MNLEGPSDYDFSHSEDYDLAGSGAEYLNEFLLADHVATEAGKELSRLQDAEFESRVREGTEKVTEIDESIEREVTEYLEGMGYEVAGEELGSETGSDGYFLIDPIDGTQNFKVGAPEYCFSIAYIEGGETRAAAIAAPEYVEEDSRKLYTALEGEGAFLSGREISVGEGDMEVVYAKVSDRSGTVRGVERPVVDALKSREGVQVRRRGAAALDGAFLAEGVGEGQVLGAINDYDVAASNLIIEEAGGEVLMDEGKIPKDEEQNYPFLVAANDEETLEELSEVYLENAGEI
ncbi:MAG: inositol monophosphatase [Candidatus Nanohaloarchaea archaeon]